MAVYDLNGDVLSDSKGGGGNYFTDDIPMVYIEGTLPTSKNDGNVSVRINFSSKTVNFSCFATLKVQGDTSSAYPKKNFTVKLYKDSEHEIKNKVSLRGWEETNKFVLKANWIDHTHARNVVNARLWSQIVKSRADFYSLPNLLKESNLAVDGFAVRVYSNGVYWGLYTWNIPKDGMYNVSDKNLSHCILNSEMNNDQSCAFNGTDISNWSDELHDSMPAGIVSGWTNVLSFVSTSSDSSFEDGVNDYIDIGSVIDFDIFARVICLVDNLCKNQIFFTYDGIKWYEGAYDLDGTWGLPPTTANNWFPYNTVFQNGYLAYRDFGVENKLYKRVETLFLEQLKERYWILRHGVLSEANIIYQFESFTNLIPTDLYALDYASTTGNGNFVNIPFKDTSNIDQIKAFVPQRIAYMDDIITNM